MNITQLFHNANAGKYNGKQSIFYPILKPYILEGYGTFDGYDLQIIEQKCWSCDGTGIYKNYHYEYGERYLLSEEPCYKCNKGIYYVKRIVLKRFTFKGNVYHIPMQSNGFEEFKNTFYGIIKHEEIDSQIAKKSFLYLLYFYRKDLFFKHIKSIIQSEYRKNKADLQRYIQRLFKCKVNDMELPF